MPTDTDAKFFDRADAHIHLANEQLEGMPRGKVSASMMYGTARFNAWVTACGFKSGSQMTAERNATIDYFVAQYRAMLEENFDDYAENFARYMQADGGKV